MKRVYVSIGSNEQPQRHIKQAIELLRQQFGQLDMSPVYESEAVGFDGDNFLNLVVGFDTTLSLEEVDEMLGGIEQQCGRVRQQEKFSPRTMDLDLLLFSDLIRHDARWDIPRDEIYKYAFVLKPLADLVPDSRHPETGETFGQMWQDSALHDQDLWQTELM